jgi:hypothetical protein
VIKENMNRHLYKKVDYQAYTATRITSLDEAVQKENAKKETRSIFIKTFPTLGKKRLKFTFSEQAGHIGYLIVCYCFDFRLIDLVYSNAKQQRHKSKRLCWNKKGTRLNFTR